MRLSVEKGSTRTSILRSMPNTSRRQTVVILSLTQCSMAKLDWVKSLACRKSVVQSPKSIRNLPVPLSSIKTFIPELPSLARVPGPTISQVPKEREAISLHSLIFLTSPKESDVSNLNRSARCQNALRVSSSMVHLAKLRLFCSVLGGLSAALPPVAHTSNVYPRGLPPRETGETEVSPVHPSPVDELCENVHFPMHVDVKQNQDHWNRALSPKDSSHAHASTVHGELKLPTSLSQSVG
jgi:hypothetical protein